MERPSYSDSDENEPSLCSPQLSAVTEALLARAGLATSLQPTAIPQDYEIDNDGSNAMQVRRSSRIANLPRHLLSQHRNPTSLRTDDRVNGEERCDTQTSGIASLQRPPKRRPKRVITASSSPELPSLDEHNISDNAPAHEYQLDVAPNGTLRDALPGPEHEVETTPSGDLDLAYSHTTQDTGHMRTGGTTSLFTTSAAHKRLPTHCSKESRDISAKETSAPIATQPPAHQYENAKQSPFPDRGKATPRDDAARGKPHSPVVREASAALNGHQAHVFPNPNISADIPSTATASTAAPAKRIVTVPERRRVARRFVVNGQPYTVTRRLGKGGSGRVYEVASATNTVWAFKTIPLKNLDERGKTQIRNEVSILASLAEADRVVYLKDWAIDEAKKSLYMVMELGQIDLENIIKDRYEGNAKLDVLFVGYYWLEMLKCVALIHSLDVVHSDLKPANFVLVNGTLKLVDFGTPNYMAPETLKALSMPSSTQQDLSRSFRFGKPSDIWSLGCILHLMVYGRQPFSHIQGLAPKFMAISDPAHVIECGAEGLGGVHVPSSYIRTMKACLSRDPSLRPRASDLLERGNGLLKPVGRTGNVVYATSQTIEALFSNALQQAGTSASPAEIKSWAGKVIENLEKKGARGRDE